jgi:hypothetical protein
MKLGDDAGERDEQVVKRNEGLSPIRRFWSAQRWKRGAGILPLRRPCTDSETCFLPH